MTALPKIGKYLSATDGFEFEILTANSSDGQITGRYTSTFDLSSAKTTVSCTGKYMWVANKGQSGTTPFCIRISAEFRPPNREHCVMEDWTGYYLEGDAVVLYGTRSKVTGAISRIPSQPVVLTLGGHTFQHKG